MRQNRFFSELDTSAYIEWLIETAAEDCDESNILDRIKACDNRPEMRAYNYQSACGFSLDLLRSLYLRGDSIESMRPAYMTMRERLRLLDESMGVVDRESFTMRLHRQIHVGTLIAMAHAMGEKREEIGRNTRGAIASGRDLFIDRLLSVYDPDRPLAGQILEKPLYGKLHAVFDAAHEKRPAMIAAYLDHWEKMLLADRHPGTRYPCPERQQGEWKGYWCYPAAAVVAALNIDDSSFIDHEFYPTDLMRACAQYRGEPVILPLPAEPALPPAPARAPRRKAAPATLKPWLKLFDLLSAPLPKSLQNTLWNALIQWLEEEWEGDGLDAAGFLQALANAQWEARLKDGYRRLLLLHVDWKDSDSALEFCADLARTAGIEDEFAPDAATLDNPHRVWAVLHSFHQWLAPRGYRLISPDTQEDAYYALMAKEDQADSVASALRKAGLKLHDFTAGEPF